MILLLMTTSLVGQRKGNGNIITQTYEMSGIDEIYVGLYADVSIDASANTGLTISIDENLIDWVGKDLTDGRLTLDQIDWMKPSTRVKIVIGAPAIYKVIQSTHDKTVVRNIDRESFRAMAQVGTIQLSGSVDQLYASGELGTIDARSLETEKVDVNLWSSGTIQLGTPKEIVGQVEDDGRIIYESGLPNIKVKMKNGGKVLSANQMVATAESNENTKYIRFKLKNNSFKRINAYVKGPKPDGSYFSYGFPMRPGQVRAKNWTVGTKVYRKTNLGIRKFLYEIKAEDEGEVIDLFDK